MSADLTFTTKAELHPNGTPDNPYKKAVEQLRQEGVAKDRRIRNLQRTVAAVVVALMACNVGTMIAVYRIQTFTYILTVDKDSGQVRDLGILPQVWRGQAPAVIDTQVRGWLYNIRRVGIDPVQNQETRHQAGAFMTLRAIRMSEQHMGDLKALEQRGATTQLKILSALPMTPDAHMMQLEWDETTVSRSGTVDSVIRWRAIVNVVVYTEQELPDDLKKRGDMRNRLGIFVEDYAWQILTEEKG